MFLRLGHSLLVLALVAAMGGHWAVLQTVAWTTMLADNLRTDSFETAVVKTFDGQHPCKMCKSISAGKKQEKKSDLPNFAKKFEFVSERPVFVFSAPQTFSTLPDFAFELPARSFQPPTPPPRPFIV